RVPRTALSGGPFLLSVWRISGRSTAGILDFWPMTAAAAYRIMGSRNSCKGFCRRNGHAGHSKVTGKWRELSRVGRREYRLGAILRAVRAAHAGSGGGDKGGSRAYRLSAVPVTELAHIRPAFGGSRVETAPAVHGAASDAVGQPETGRLAVGHDGDS